MSAGSFTKFEIRKGTASEYGHDHYEIEFTTEDGHVFKSSGTAHYSGGDFKYVRGAVNEILHAVEGARDLAATNQEGAQDA